MQAASFKLGRYQVGDQILIGQLEGDFIKVVCEQDELNQALEAALPAAHDARQIALVDVRMLPPVDPRARIFAVAVNYHAHGAEAKAKPPERPLAFYKAPSNFVGHKGVLNPDRTLTTRYDYEGEIGVVIGKRCKSVTVEDALDYVVGICALNDGSARDLTRVPAGQGWWPDWTAAKGLDEASALGPAITCGTKVVDALRTRSLFITTRLNGEEVQNCSMKEMIFSTEEIIATLSSYMVLLPGDVIATGTPAGVGVARDRYLVSGDELSFEVGEPDVIQLDTLHVKVA
jgi:2-keto-4-pentenoate hydratase/2-oxohepta-3-ene-1,7-dioic acid hydratase in catechol pathway